MGDKVVVELPRQRSNSLTELLDRRQWIAEQSRRGEDIKPVMQVFNPLIEFQEIPISEIIRYQDVFHDCDTNSKGFLTMEELKSAMRKLNTVLTHMELIQIIRDLNPENEKLINLREFISIYKVLGAATPFKYNHHKKRIVNQVEVGKVGVGGAKHFFEDKAARTVESPFQTELRLEKEKVQRERENEEKRRRNLTAKASAFGEVKRSKTPTVEVDQALSKLKIRKIKSRPLNSERSEDGVVAENSGLIKFGRADRYRHTSAHYSSDSGLGVTVSRSVSLGSYTHGSPPHT